MSQKKWVGPSRVLVTGGGTGIGLAVVQALIDVGTQVVAVGRRSDALESAKSIGAEIASWDVTCDQEGLFQAIGHVDGLVHNAGLCIRSPITEWSSEDWESMWRVNVLAPALLSKAFAAQITGPGAIVAVSSTLAERPAPQTAGYGTTKAALINLTKHLALELAPQGIRANAVLPGIVPTDMTNSDVHDEFLVGLHPLGRLGQTAEVARAVLSALELEWMTGAQIAIDGGLLIRE